MLLIYKEERRGCSQPDSVIVNSAKPQIKLNNVPIVAI